MTRKRVFFLAAAACLIVLAAFIAGCSLDVGNPTAPTVSDSAGSASTDKIADGPHFVRYRQAPEHMQAKSLPETPSVTALITREEGGYLAVSDADTKAMLEIPSYAIPQDEIIRMALPQEDIVTVEFGPSGVVFTPPATLMMSGTGLVLPQGSIYLYCLNEETGEWESTGQKAAVEVNGPVTTITSEIPHFSRYAWGSR